MRTVFGNGLCFGLCDFGVGQQVPPGIQSVNRSADVRDGPAQCQNLISEAKPTWHTQAVVSRLVIRRIKGPSQSGEAVRASAFLGSSSRTRRYRTAASAAWPCCRRIQTQCVPGENIGGIGGRWRPGDSGRLRPIAPLPDASDRVAIGAAGILGFNSGPAGRLQAASAGRF